MFELLSLHNYRVFFMLHFPNFNSGFYNFFEYEKMTELE